MSRNIVTGIDIGTYQVKVLVAERGGEGSLGMPRIIAAAAAETHGVRHGYITHPNEVVASIKAAVAEAEKIAKIKIRKAFLSVGGIGLSSIVSQGSTIISRADSEISELDITKAIEASENEIPQSASINKKIIHTIPLQYKVDGKPVLGQPEGTKGTKLEVKTLFITCLEHHLNDLIEAVEEAGVEVQDITASPIAASLVTLTKQQKVAGCMLANIGAETVSIAVFENNIPISLEVLPIGSTDITNDIALGLKIPLEEAEQVKVGTITSTTYPRKKLEEIIVARLSDIFELIEVHLKKINRNGLLPAGIVITGGGSGIGTIEDLARVALKLPSRIASIHFKENSKEIKDASSAVAYGLCILGLNADDAPGIKRPGVKIVGTIGRKVSAWLRPFLP
ncbi:cell division protein FtsA [Patescibacteria group bacterium]|nr:MAG: cell division protein FtsA [Patescibacteria group bacterium]